MSKLLAGRYELAVNHENKNMITRAVGADYTVDADFFSLPIQVDDIVLICTDGLYGEVGEDQLVAALKQEKSMTDICNELVEMANIGANSQQDCSK